MNSIFKWGKKLRRSVYLPQSKSNLIITKGKHSVRRKNNDALFRYFFTYRLEQIWIFQEKKTDTSRNWPNLPRKYLHSSSNTINLKNCAQRANVSLVKNTYLEGNAYRMLLVIDPEWWIRINSLDVVATWK